MRKRIFIIAFSIMTLMLVFYAVLSTQLFYDSAVLHTKGHLKVYMNAYSEEFSFDNYGAQAFSQQLNGVRVTFLDGNGTVTGDSEQPSLVGSAHVDREEVKLAQSEGEGYSVRSSDSIGADMVYYCVKTDSGYVRLALFTDSELGVFKDSVPTLAWFVFVIIIICMVFTYLASEHIISPVKKIARDAAMSREVKPPYPELKPVTDILNRRNMEVASKIKELSEEKELVERAQKSKNEFISNITHEMNTPLTSIKGYTELLSGGMLNGEQQKIAYSTILNQSERLTKLVSRVINYNELDNDELPSYEVNASTLLKDLISTLMPSMGKKSLSLKSDIEDGIIVNSRFERVNQVFSNLIRNAIRYNKEGGEIAITLKKEENGAVFSVRDTGIGISEKDIGRIFERFYTVDKSHNGVNGGFGLGLATVKKICKRSGWIISVESKIDEGTCFTVKIK